MFRKHKKRRLKSATGGKCVLIMFNHVSPFIFILVNYSTIKFDCWIQRKPSFFTVFFLLFSFTDIAITLKDVRVLVPSAVRRGENVDLQCQYDLEGDTLYSVKWYKGKREFFRFTPKENPSLKVFPVTGINVEVNCLLPRTRFHQFYSVFRVYTEPFESGERWIIQSVTHFVGCKYLTGRLLHASFRLTRYTHTGKS